MNIDVLMMAFLVGCLSVAIVTDLCFNKIPNWLILITVVSGVFGHVFYSHFMGALFSASGLLIGFLCFVPFYAFGKMGAGDVKLLAAVGSVVGPKVVVVAALMTIIAGGVIALAYITLRGGLPAMVRRYISMFVLLAARQPQYIPPAPGEAAGLRFPYALAIACGTALAVI